MLIVAVNLALNLLFVVVYFGNFTYRSLSLLPITMLIFLWLLRDVRRTNDAHISSSLIMDIIDDLRVVDGSRIARGVALWSIIGMRMIVSVLDKLLLMLTLFWWCPQNASLLLCSSTIWVTSWKYFLRVNLSTGFTVSYGVKIRWGLCAWSHVSCRTRLGFTGVYLLAWTQSIRVWALISLVFLMILSTVTIISFGLRCGSFRCFIILAVINFFDTTSMSVLNCRRIRVLSLSSVSVLNSTMDSS